MINSTCCSVGLTIDFKWEKCVIIEHWPADGPTNETPYKVRLLADNRERFVLKDTHEHIRPCDFEPSSDHRQEILHMVKYGVTPRIIMERVDMYHLNWDVYGPMLMHYAATYGFMDLLTFIAKAKRLDPCTVNAKGQNILHLAIFCQYAAVYSSCCFIL